MLSRNTYADAFTGSIAHRFNQCPSSRPQACKSRQRVNNNRPSPEDNTSKKVPRSRGRSKDRSANRSKKSQVATAAAAAAATTTAAAAPCWRRLAEHVESDAATAHYLSFDTFLPALLKEQEAFAAAAAVLAPNSSTSVSLTTESDKAEAGAAAAGATAGASAGTLRSVPPLSPEESRGENVPPESMRGGGEQEIFERKISEGGRISEAKTSGKNNICGNVKEVEIPVGDAGYRSPPAAVVGGASSWRPPFLAGRWPVVLSVSPDSVPVSKDPDAPGALAPMSSSPSAASARARAHGSSSSSGPTSTAAATPSGGSGSGVGSCANDTPGNTIGVGAQQDSGSDDDSGKDVRNAANGGSQQLPETVRAAVALTSTCYKPAADNNDDHVASAAADANAEATEGRDKSAGNGKNRCKPPGDDIGIKLMGDATATKSRAGAGGDRRLRARSAASPGKGNLARRRVLITGRNFAHPSYPVSRRATRVQEGDGGHVAVAAPGKCPPMEHDDSSAAMTVDSGDTDPNVGDDKVETDRVVGACPSRDAARNSGGGGPSVADSTLRKVWVYFGRDVVPGKVLSDTTVEAYAPPRCDPGFVDIVVVVGGVGGGGCGSGYGGGAMASDSAMVTANGFCPR